MPTSAEIRTWANGEGGYQIGPKGNIPTHVRDAYDAAHPGLNGDDVMPGVTDYPDPGFEAAFADEPPGDTGETPPSRPKTRTRGSGSGAKPGPRFSFGRRGNSTGKQGKPKRKRIPVDDLISSAWGVLARLATPLPPLQRTLRVQAPVAGILLEDAVKDTAADVLLQPVARFAQQGKTVTALLGPPVIVTAISVHIAQAAAQDQQPNPVFLGIAHEALRGSLMTWMDVAGPKFEQAIAHEKEFEEKYGTSVDQFMAWLFSPPVSEADQAGMQAEEDAIRRAQGMAAA
jgi:hypothetical protein